MGAVPGIAEDLKLINAIFSKSVKGDLVDAIRFRAAHEDDIDHLDRLERQQVLRRDSGGRYVVTLYGLSLIDSVAVRDLWKVLSKVFLELRKFYKESPNTQILVSRLRDKTHLSQNKIECGLGYLRDASIFGGSLDLSAADASICPSEGILKFKTFEALLKEHRRVSDFYSRVPVARSVSLEESPLTKFSGRGAVERKSGLAHSTVANIPLWLSHTNENIRQLMEEVYRASSVDARALACMGLRAVIDLVFVEKLGDMGAFEAKLSAFQKGDHITERDRKILDAVLDIGSASAHRGYIPSVADLALVMGIVENFLQRIYAIEPNVEEWSSRVPKRSPKKK